MAAIDTSWVLVVSWKAEALPAFRPARPRSAAWAGSFLSPALTARAPGRQCYAVAPWPALAGRSARTRHMGTALAGRTLGRARRAQAGRRAPTGRPRDRVRWCHPATR